MAGNYLMCPIINFSFISLVELAPREANLFSQKELGPIKMET
jgi:hypothetical protein